MLAPAPLRAPVRPQSVFAEEGRHIGEARSEERSNKGRRLLAVEGLQKEEPRHRIGQEGLLHCRRKSERRRAENREASRVRQIRRYFERDMAAEAPAQEARIWKRERVDDGSDSVRMSFQGIGAVARVLRIAMPGEIYRDEPEPLSERPVDLSREGARG